MNGLNVIGLEKKRTHSQTEIRILGSFFAYCGRFQYGLLEHKPMMVKFAVLSEIIFIVIDKFVPEIF